MGGHRATLQQLQVLQSARPLDAPPAYLGNVELPDAAKQPKELLERSKAEGADLRDVVKTAEFWISLLEGEHTDLAEEVATHKQRHQLAVRQAEAKASALREADGEKRRLLSELKWLRESRDQAICERSVIKDRNVRLSDDTKQDMDSLEARASRLEDELQREREEKASLEATLVRTKVRYAETLQRADSMEYLIAYYEDQLKGLNPNFEKTDLKTAAAWRRGLGRHDAIPESSDLESDREVPGEGGGQDRQGQDQEDADEEKDEGKEKKGSGLKGSMFKIKRMLTRPKDDLKEKAAPATPADADQKTASQKEGVPTVTPRRSGFNLAVNLLSVTTPRQLTTSPQAASVSAAAAAAAAAAEAPEAVAKRERSSSTRGTTPRDPTWTTPRQPTSPSAGGAAGAAAEASATSAGGGSPDEAARPSPPASTASGSSSRARRWELRREE